MSRYFMIQSWVGSHENEPDYNGQQCGERNVHSSEVVPLYDKFGNANIKGFSDEAIEARKPKKSSIPLKQRILPQATRVERLTAQMIELCAEYKAGLHTLEEYSLLLSVVSAKRARAEQLLAKAISVKGPFERGEDPVPSTNKALPREILRENKRSTLKHKQIKPKTENVKNDRKCLSKVADWINRNSFIYFIGCSTIALTAAKLVF